MQFPVAGVEVHPLWPFLVALLVSFFSSLGGVSGAFLLLPYQVTVLGFQSPAVSSTNLVFNLLAIPAGVFRFFREGRLLWPLAWPLTSGLVPGVCAGVLIRITVLPDPRVFKLFVGFVLLVVGLRLARDLLRGLRARETFHALSEQVAPRFLAARTISRSWRRVVYRYGEQSFRFDPRSVLLLGLAVGIVSGAYGIGGGSLTAPLLVVLFGLPIHTVAGATLAATLVTSVIGLAVYTWIAPWFAVTGLPVAPDWKLGLVLGLGGMCGIYLGARCQKLVAGVWIRALLSAVILFVAFRYVIQFVSAL